MSRKQPEKRRTSSDAPWGLAAAVTLVLVFGATTSALDACKSEETVADADAGSVDAEAVCDSAPNEWRVHNVGLEAVGLDDGGTAANLFSIWGDSDQAIFAVGSQGKVVFFDGSSWVAQPTPTERDLKAVWGVSPVDVWAVGFGAVVLQYDGAQWNDRSPPLPLLAGTDGGLPADDAGLEAIKHNLWGVWVAGKGGPQGQPVTSAVFAVGDRGTVLHFKDGVWTALEAGVEENLKGVWGASESNVFIAGQFGTVLQGSVAGLTKQQTGTDQALQAVWGRGASDVYAVGLSGTVLHYNGSDWQEVGGAPKQFLRSVWGAPGSRDTYLVGWDGALFKLSGGRGGEYGIFSCLTRVWLHDIWGTMIEVPYVPDPIDDAGTIPDIDVGDATVRVPAIWISGASGTVIQGP